MNAFYRGKTTVARTHYESGLPLLDASLDTSYDVQEARVNLVIHIAWNQWHQGYPDAALQSKTHATAALATFEDISNPFMRAAILNSAIQVHQYRREPHAANEIIEWLIPLCYEYHFPYWLGGALLRQGWALAMTGQIEAGVQHMERGLKTVEATGAGIWMQYGFALLAEVYG